MLPAVVAYQAQQTSSATAAAGPGSSFPVPPNLWGQTPASIIGPIGLSGGQAAYDESMLNCNVTVSCSCGITPPYGQYGGSVAASFTMPFATSSVDIVATDWTWTSYPYHEIVTGVTLSIKIDGTEQTIVAK